MQLETDNGNGDEKMKHSHGIEVAPDPDNMLLAPQLIPLAADKKAPLSAKLTGVKYELKPGDTVTVLGDPREYLVALSPSPHNELQHLTIESPSTKYRSAVSSNVSPIPANIYPQSDPKSDADSDAQIRLPAHRSGARPSSLPSPPTSPSPSPTGSQKSQRIAAIDASDVTVPTFQHPRAQGEPDIQPMVGEVTGSTVPARSLPLQQLPQSAEGASSKRVVPGVQYTQAVNFAEPVNPPVNINSNSAAGSGVAVSVNPATSSSARTSVAATARARYKMRMAATNAPASVNRAVSNAAASAVVTGYARYSTRMAAGNKLEKLSKAAEAKLEAVPRMSVDYVQVMLHLGAMDVVSVQMLRNEEVDMAFAVAISGVPGEHKLVKVLHGTNVDAIDAIVREGFKLGGEEVQMRNGCARGKGVYLTTSAETAVGYSQRVQCKYVMLCELCVDTKCIRSKGGIYVQPDKALVRPLYVVEFRRPY